MTYTEAITQIAGQLGVPIQVVREWEAPQVFCFEIVPLAIPKRGSGVKVTTIGSLRRRSADIALALGVSDTRFTQDGRLILEVPKPTPSIVHASALCSREQMRGLLPVRLGQKVDGPTLVLDLTGTPHLLIAGTTGSGKSVCIKVILTELIRWNPPRERGWEKCFQRGEAGRAVELRLIDLKRVELTEFWDIRHISALETEFQGARNVLARTLADIESRYRAMEAKRVSGIKDTNNLHYIVTVIDEFADLVLQDASVIPIITRIAQLGRAAGVHLVMATQRPSVDVVAGIIKANFPTRISFRVASGIDSRVVLDQLGAEKLLGKGDGLLLAADVGLIRFQGAWPDDMQEVLNSWK